MKINIQEKGNMAYQKQLKAAIESYYKHNINDASKAESMQLVTLFIKCNKEWDDSFLSTLTSLNSSIVFDTINVQSFIHFARHNKERIHLLQILEQTSTSSPGSFYGLLSLINKINVIKQSQLDKTKRMASADNFTQSERCISQDCEHILIPETQKLMQLIVDTQTNHPSHELTKDIRKTITSTLDRVNSPNNQTSTALLMLISVLERNIHEESMDLLMDCHAIRQRWNIPLSSITNHYDIPNDKQPYHIRYYIKLLSKLTPKDVSQSYESRKNNFFQFNLHSLPPERIDEIITLQKDDISRFIHQASFSDTLQFMTNCIIPDRINHTNRESVTGALSMLFESLSKSVNASTFFSFLYITIQRLKETTETNIEQAYSVIKLFKRETDEWINENIFSLENQTPNEKLWQRALIYSMLSHEDNEDSLPVRLLNAKWGSKPYIDLKKNIFWCFSQEKIAVKRFLIDSGIKDDTNFACLYSSKVIGADAFKNCDAISSLQISTDYEEEHPLITLLRSTSNYRKIKDNFENVIAFIKKCQAKNYTPFDRNILSQILVRAMTLRHKNKEHLEYLIGDPRTGANPNYVLTDNEKADFIASTPTFLTTDTALTVTSLPLLSILFIFDTSHDADHAECLRNITTLLIKNGAYYLSPSSEAASVLELYWDALDPGTRHSKMLKGNERINHYYQWVSSLPKIDGKNFEKKISGGLITKLCDYRRYVNNAFEKVNETFNHLFCELNLIFDTLSHDPKSDSVVVSFLSSIKKDLAYKLLDKKSPNHLAIIKSLNELLQSDKPHDEIFRLINNTRISGVAEVILKIDKADLSFPAHLLFRIICDSVWFDTLTYAINRDELSSNANPSTVSVNHLAVYSSFFAQFEINSTIPVLSYAVMFSRLHLLKALINSKYENKFQETYGNTAAESAFLVSLIANTFTVRETSSQEMLYPREFDSYAETLDIFIKNIKPHHPAIEILKNYTDLVIFKDKKTEQNNQEIEWIKSNAQAALNRIISKLDFQHFLSCSIEDFQKLLANFGKLHLTLTTLAAQLNSIITNTATSIKHKRICFQFIVQMVNNHTFETYRNAILTDSLLLHKKEHLLFNTKSAKSDKSERSPSPSLLMDYFQPNSHYNTDVAIHFLLNGNGRLSLYGWSYSQEKIIKTLLYWLKADSSYQLTEKNLDELFSLIDSMNEQQLIELLDTHVGSQLFDKHISRLLAHLRVSDRNCSLSRIIEIITKTKKLTIPVNNMVLIAYFLIISEELASLKILFSNSKFNLNTQRRIRVNSESVPKHVQQLKRFKPTNRTSSDITFTLFECALFLNKNPQILRLMRQQTSFKDTELEDLLSDLQLSVNESTYFQRSKILLDPNQTLIPPDTEIILSDSELKGCFSNLSDNDLSADIIYLIYRFLGISEQRTKAIESSYNQTIANQLNAKKRDVDSVAALTLFINTCYASRWKTQRQLELSVEEKNCHNFWLKDDGSFTRTAAKMPALPLSGDRLILFLTKKRNRLSNHQLIIKTIEQLSGMSFNMTNHSEYNHYFDTVLISFDTLERFIDNIGYELALDHDDPGTQLKHRAISKAVIDFIEASQDHHSKDPSTMTDELISQMEAIWQGEHHDELPSLVREVLI